MILELIILVKMDAFSKKKKKRTEKRMILELITSAKIDRWVHLLKTRI
jgi:hypothetical protein